LLDPSGKGYLTKEDIRKYLQAEYVYPSEKDLQAIVAFFVPDNKDTISLRDWDA
jgi:hypothetical protein